MKSLKCLSIIALSCLLFSCDPKESTENEKFVEAASLFQNGKYNEAIVKYQELLDADFEKATSAIGWCYVKLNMIDEAYGYYVQCDTSSYDVIGGLAVVYWAKGIPHLAQIKAKYLSDNASNWVLSIEDFGNDKNGFIAKSSITDIQWIGAASTYEIGMYSDCNEFLKLIDPSFMVNLNEDGFKSILLEKILELGVIV